jgi:DNA-binding transcriptional MerR regulator
MEQTYWSKEVSKLLQIADSTLRKYCLALEDSNYRFERGINNSRIFYNKDVLLLQRVIAAREKKGITLEQAVNIAMASDTADTVATDVMEETPTITPHNSAMTDDKTQEILQAMFLEMERMRKEQGALIEHVKRLEDQLEKREAGRDAALIELIRDTQETKRLIAAEEQRRSSQSFWARLFGK